MCLFSSGVLCEIECFVKPIREANELKNVFGDEATRKGYIGKKT